MTLPRHIAEERRRRHRARINAQHRYIPPDFLRSTPQETPPPEVLADRARRESAPLTRAMVLFGDPPFPQSALGKLLEGQP